MLTLSLSITKELQTIMFNLNCIAYCRNLVKLYFVRRCPYFPQALQVSLVKWRISWSGYDPWAIMQTL